MLDRRIGSEEAHSIAVDLVRQSVPLDQEYRDEGYKITSTGTVLDRNASRGSEHLDAPTHSPYTWVGKLACATHPEGYSYVSQTHPVARAIIEMDVTEIQQIQGVEALDG